MAHILLIDDDTLALESMTIVLEDNGYEVSTAVNGAIGLLMIDMHSFDLVITDLIMPEKEGIATLIEVKRDHPALKTIVISGGGRNQKDLYLEYASNLGANDVLAKPFSASELTTSVRHVLAL